MKNLFTLSLCLLTFFESVAQSSLPVVSVIPFSGRGSTEQAKASISAGLTQSRRIRLVDRQTLEKVLDEQRTTTSDVFKDNSTIIKTGQLTGAQYVLEGTVTDVNFGNAKVGDKYYNTCKVAVELKLTDIETGLSESTVLRGGVQSEGQVDEGSAFATLRNDAEMFARRRFPASMQILEILEMSEKKGIVSFRVEGEGLTSKRPQGDAVWDFGGKTQIRITSSREVERPDGSKRTINEEVAMAKIKTVEDGGTAICTVSDGGKKLQELWEKKAPLSLKTTN
ncbi:MAG: hypothetical protein EAZ91_25340 [Cytophagales bacterium]|nr:MAG: hypothetical protein EAZ91_25340 [Cytophagales bacterium]